MVAARLRPMYAAEAKKRMAAGGGDHCSEAARKAGSAELRPPVEPKQKSCAAVARKLLVSPRGVEQAVSVLERGARFARC